MIGAKTWPRKTAARPQRSNQARARSTGRGLRARGPIDRIAGPSARPTHHDSVVPASAPATAPAQIGRKSSEPAATSAPTPTNIAEDGTRKATKASDSLAASRATTHGAHARLCDTKSSRATTQSGTVGSAVSSTVAPARIAPQC